MGTRARLCLTALLTLQPVLLACGVGESGSAGSSVSARDSAGIEIVDVMRPHWKEGEAWTVSAEPLLEIGSVDGEEPYQFFRIAHAIRLADGSIVVADRGSQELRWFSADGRFVRRVGGQGEGPGEFDSLFALRQRGDTLWAHDFRMARLTAFDNAGAVLRTVQLGGESGRPMEVWPVANGFLGHILETNYDITPDLAYHRRTATYLRYDRDGAVVDSIDALPGLEFLISGGPAGGNTFVATSTSPLVGHSSQQAVVGDRLVAGITDRFEIRVYGPAGRLERLIRDSSRDLPVTDAEWDAVVDQAMADAETAEQRRTVQTLAELRPAPETRPAFSRFVSDLAGCVWIAPYRPIAGRPVDWLVVAVDGVLMGTVDLPEGFRPTEIGQDYALGVMRDEFDVEHVLLYGLNRGATLQ